MPEDENRKGGFLAFWTTLPGILTGLAALITAVVGAVALFKTQESNGKSSEPATTVASTTGGGTTAQGKFLHAGRVTLLRGDNADLERGLIGNSSDVDLSFGPETTPTIHYSGASTSFFAPVDARPTKSACVAALNGRHDTEELISEIERKWTCVSTTEGNVAVVRVVSAPGVGSAKLVLSYTVWR
jgi:hypothetical protein